MGNFKTEISIEIVGGTICLTDPDDIETLAAQAHGHSDIYTTPIPFGGGELVYREIYGNVHHCWILRMKQKGIEASEFPAPTSLPSDESLDIERNELFGVPIVARIPEITPPQRKHELDKAINFVQLYHDFVEFRFALARIARALNVETDALPILSKTNREVVALADNSDVAADAWKDLADEALRHIHKLLKGH